MKKIIIFLLILIVLPFAYSASQCSDGIDNDCDSSIDMADSGCSSSSDNSENVLTGYANGCLNYGDKLANGCNITSYLCEHDLCRACIGIMERGAYTTVDYKCYGLPDCGYNSSGSGLENDAPVITINNPIDSSIQISTSLWVNVSVNEDSKIERYDAYLNRWVTLCTSCSAYSRKLTFKEGPQELLLRASDRAGLPSEKSVSFIVDSKKPRIKYIEPKKGFADGSFHVKFQEDNPSILNLFYGNPFIGYRDEELALDDCAKTTRGYSCDSIVGLTDYDNSTIEYWFNLTDIVGNSAANKHVLLSVDTTFPVISRLNYTIKGRYVNFNISVIEQNFDELTYIDWSARLPRSRRMCSALKSDSCAKKASFANGPHDLTIQAIDKAGNSVAEEINFNISY